MSDRELTARMDKLERNIQVREAAAQASRVDGRSLTDWVPILDQLRAQKREDETLALLERLFPANEAYARIMRDAPLATDNDVNPLVSFYERAAIIYRRRKNYAAEIAVIERYLSHCLPGKAYPKMIERLNKARELQARSMH
jgi:tetratricopeptide (TPR) repeat protein